MNEDMICPHCGKQMVEHITQEGARFHVTSYHSGINGALSHCSEKNCERNHGEGHCVPYSEETTQKLRKLQYTGGKGFWMSYTAVFLSEEVEKKIKKHSTGTEFQEDYIR